MKCFGNKDTGIHEGYSLGAECLFSMHKVPDSKSTLKNKVKLKKEIKK